MSNRLSNSLSPYLRQHAENPVDWFPWGDEAFERARAEDRPIFLSVGYSSCHWCHVMAHECFEDRATAALMNDAFINVKVDREVLPHVDEAYMTFVQLLTGRGGWPTSVFLTPSLEPFFGGTYWPREDRAGQAGFVSICRRVSDAWQTSRADLEQAAKGYADELREALLATASAPSVDVGSRPILDVITELRRRFDPVQGGFGGAPKFPPHSELELLLEIATRASDDAIRLNAQQMAFRTLERMALGGIYDHVGGGFHRYSTDADWFVPHFEKMLYDNALLLDRYALAAKQSEFGLFERVVQMTVRWLKREMTSPEGLFYSALDADSEGREGKYYVWNWEEVQYLPDAAEFCRAFGCRREGNFKDEATDRLTGGNLLHLLRDEEERFKSQLESLLERRKRRVRPGLDDKCLVGWNGLAIAGLVQAGERGMAEQAAGAILTAEQRHGRMPHMVVGEEPAGTAFLEDYAFFVYGLTLLGTPWTSEARRIADEMIDRFADPICGGFFSTIAGDALFARGKQLFDQPLPSANAIAIRAMTNLGWDSQARFHLDRLKEWTLRAPQVTGALATTCLMAPGPRVGGPASARVVKGAGKLQELLVEIAPAYHINGNVIADPRLVPTTISFNGATGKAHYPVGRRYSGALSIPFELDEGAGPCLFLRYQACTETECLVPVDLAVEL
jgi:uncharacterized protein